MTIKRMQNSIYFDKIFILSILRINKNINFEICFQYINNFLNNHINKSKITASLQLMVFTEEEIKKCLAQMTPNSGMGDVGIESIVFIECANALSKIITHLFNLIILTGTFPNDWKCAHISPIYKGKGSKSQLENYRPISIISPIAKLFESLISKQIYSFLEINNLLDDSQFGFRKNKSCEMALQSLTDSWKNHLDKGQDIISVFLDLSKAFDTVDHQLLLAKLPYYNFDKNTIDLLADYLKDRSIKVKVNGKLSEPKKLHFVIPQGSVLGPLLFIIYINDFHN